MCLRLEPDSCLATTGRDEVDRRALAWIDIETLADLPKNDWFHFEAERMSENSLSG
jgi:hypothetical protein